MDTLHNLKINNFDLKHTLENGQFFTYFKEDDFYYIINGDTIFKIKQQDNILYYSGINEGDIISFFNLNHDYSDLLLDVDDYYLKLAFVKYKGMKIIHSDLWMTIISFVCSSASNIPKIKMNLNLLSKTFGNEIIIDEKKFYTFPEPGTLNNLNRIKNCKTGFRSKYIYAINNLVLENPKLLEEIKSMPYENAKKTLMTFPGIGEKVADCICLFSLNHYEAFPVDTWIKQVFQKYYFKEQVKNSKLIYEYARKNFKSHIGIKGQYLFHYIRHEKE